MPLIILTGYPCSGKTTRALELRDYFIERIGAAQAAQKSGLSLPTTPEPPADEDENGSMGKDGAVNLDPAEVTRIARLKVHWITIDSLRIDRESYREARSEKEARATEYSAIKRFLGPETIVISDSLNYIKGYRYQLYCEAKAVLTPSCVVHIASPPDKCRAWNSARALYAQAIHPPTDPLNLAHLMYITPGESEIHSSQLPLSIPQYSDDILENLIFRYEEPNGMNRWDSPLFTVPWIDSHPPCEAIWDAVVGHGSKQTEIRPNRATVLRPAREADYLHELDRVTQEVVGVVLEAQKNGLVGGQVHVPGCSQVIDLPPQTISLPQLQRIRRQYISLNRSHVQAMERMRELFVGYLNTSL